MPLSIYGASKLHHASLWIKLRRDWPQFTWTARWPTEHVGTFPDTAEFAHRFWKEDEEDVFAADVVMVYAEPFDTLRGALVEAGMGIAYGREVLCVGSNKGFGTWQYHPSVSRVDSLQKALMWLNDRLSR